MAYSLDSFSGWRPLAAGQRYTQFRKDRRVQAESWFTVVGCSAVVGGAIDFLLGPGRRKKVRDWLELRWYGVAEVAWSNFGKQEAGAYLAVFDTIFGRSLFSKQRILLSVALAMIIALLASLVTVILFPNAYSLDSHFLETSAYTIVVSAILFAISLSISRVFANMACHIIGTGIIRNVLLFAVVTSAYYVTVELGTELTYHTRHLVSLTVADWLTGATNFDAVLRSLQFTMEHSPRVLSSFMDEFPWKPDALVSLLSIADPAMRSLDWSTLQYLLTTDMMLVLSMGLRLVFAVVFFVMFAAQGLVRGPVLLVWERVVEDDRPVFTLLFGGAAAFAKALQSMGGP